MKMRLYYNTTTVAVAIAVIVISTATLSYLSYRYTVGRENLVETSLVQSNMKLATQTIDRIEQKIIDNDRVLSEMVNVDEPSKWPEQVEAIKLADLNVEQVYFLRLDSNIPVYPPYSDRIKASLAAFRASFRLPELNLEQLAPDQTHHLHQERVHNYFFASYVLKQDRKGEKYLICFQMNVDKLINQLDKYLRPLQADFYVSVVDFDNNGVYSQPLSKASKYYYETRFPSTLYKWILQVVPRNYTEIEQDVTKQLRTNLFFIILSMFLTLLSLAVISLAAHREQQLRKLKEDFIANVSHELKTPISLIRMFSEMLVTGRVKSGEARDEYHQVIFNESDRMSRLVNNLLDFANLERGSGKRGFERVDIAGLLSKEMEAYRYQVQKEGFQMTVDVEPVPETYADPNAVTMAFFNLLDNSVKYSGDRKFIGVKIRQTNGFIDLSVQDAGLGIDAAEQGKIFDKFYRGTNATSRKIRGSGIGLSLTKNVAEMHGGDVLVQSEPGKGSTFTLRIPVVPAPEDSP
jgi:two-component system, OmpR family, phosphate regulon sensor histidine kinase PhoR